MAAHLDGLEGAIEAAKARSTALSGTVHLAGPAEFLAAGVVPLLPSLLAEGLTLRV